MLNNIRGAVFDMDGTLVDSLFIWETIWDAFGAKYKAAPFRPTKEDDKAVRTMLLKDAMEFIHTRYDMGADGQDLLDTVNEVISDFYQNQVQLKDGVLEFLEYCKGKNLPMCIASASDRDIILTATNTCGIAHYFSEILSCSDIGKGKEKPDIYLLAAEKLGISPEETCVFEDSLTAIATAHSIGMKTVGIYDEHNYGQDEIQRIATVYIAPGETLKKLIPEA